MLHTIIGGTGTIGKLVVEELLHQKQLVRSVARRKQEVPYESMQADALNQEEIDKAIEGSSYVYLCIMLPYNAKTWSRDWPIAMKNVIEACLKHDAVLVFLDNIYMYGPKLEVPMTEEHSLSPVSKKGESRHHIANMVQDGIVKKGLKAVIGRAADFYGPNANQSVLYISFLENMLQGKAPQSVAYPEVKHTYAHTRDVARGLVELALHPDTHSQVWHLPVGKAVTMEEVTQKFNENLGTDFKISFIPPFLRGILALFIPVLKEVNEMQYQFKDTYVLSDEKFRQRFPEFRVSSYEEGIPEMIQSFRQSES
ncbi:MAG: NAD-dependent epimerase/dehydratase family protein [Bacteroidota bacterium]